MAYKRCITCKRTLNSIKKFSLLLPYLCNGRIYIRLFDCSKGRRFKYKSGYAELDISGILGSYNGVQTELNIQDFCVDQSDSLAAVRIYLKIWCSPTFGFFLLKSSVYLIRDLYNLFLPLYMKVSLTINNLRPTSSVGMPLTFLSLSLSRSIKCSYF